MEPLKLFTWGYWGWGNATRQLIQAVDAVEVSRGYSPPVFVDIRLSRSVRAPGFNGRAFEETVGSARYRWLPDLGNLAVQEDGDEAIRIKNPIAAEDLLDIATEASRENRRVLFFCACEYPGADGEEGCCHRSRVAGLVLEAAQRRNLPAQVIEWPGGVPPATGFEIDVAEAAFEKVRRGAVWIPLEEPVALADVAGLPWGTLTFVRCRGKGPESYVRLLAGPARYAKTGWQLPVCEDIYPEDSSEEIGEQITSLRAETGFAARSFGIAQPDTPIAVAAEELDRRPAPMKRRATRSYEGGFMAPLQPDTVLAAITGSEPMVRTELTTKLWSYIVEHKLQDTKNKKLLNCDDKFRALTGKDQVTMFELTKFVSEHIVVPEDEPKGPESLQEETQDKA